MGKYVYKKSTGNDKEQLQSDLHKMSAWGGMRELKFNESKCKNDARRKKKLGFRMQDRRSIRKLKFRERFRSTSTIDPDLKFLEHKKKLQ